MDDNSIKQTRSNSLARLFAYGAVAISALFLIPTTTTILTRGCLWFAQCTPRMMDERPPLIALFVVELLSAILAVLAWRFVSQGRQTGVRLLWCYYLVLIGGQFALPLLSILSY